MGAARSDAATSAHSPTSASRRTLAAVTTMAPIPNAYATGIVHGNVTMFSANGFSVNSRVAAEGREALSQYGLADESERSLSQSSVAPGPTTMAPASVATAPETSAVPKAFHFRRTSGHSSMGASEGFSATTTPRIPPDVKGWSRRSAIHAATSNRARTG